MSVMAGRISKEEACQKALDFLQTKHGTCRAPQGRHLKIIPSIWDQVYLFNDEAGEGFIVVSAYDETVPILAYGEENTIDLNNISPELQYWFDNMNQQIKAVSSGKARAAQVPTHATISPMITSLWNQNAPYNLKVQTSSNQYVTGCVATAMAQIMYYHRWPESITQTVPSPGKALLNLEPTTFKWDLMRDTYQIGDIDEGAQEVAKLMAYCGYVAKMDYDEGSSGAMSYNAVEGMRQYMGYANSTDIIYRADYTAEEWDAIIYKELEEGRPVLYSGYSSEGGHAFVCDGYDGKGFYHINWGWGGTRNNYFRLSILNPYVQGIGGIPGTDGYSIWQNAIIGIQKSTTEYETLRLTTSRIFSQATEFTRTVDTDDFSIRVYSYLTNNITPSQSITFDTAFGLYQGENLIVQYDGVSNKNVASGSFVSTSKTLNIGSGLKDGVYQLRALHRKSGSSDWIKPQFANTCYLQLTISGNKMTTTEVNNTWYSKKNLTSMVVNSVVTNGSLRASKPLEIVANIKNTGEFCTGILILQYSTSSDFNEKSTTLVSSIGVNINPGDTDDVIIHCKPTVAGKAYFRLVNYADERILKEFSVDVTSAPVISLQGSATVANATLKSGYTNYYDLSTEALSVTMQINNLSSDDYEDYIVGFIFSKAPDDNSWPNSSTYERAYVRIPAGESVPVTLEFGNLIPDMQYTIGTYYYDGADRKNLTVSGMGVYLVSGVTAIDDVSQEDCSPVRYFDLQGREVGKDARGLVIMKQGNVVKKVMK